jgi:hypothetical protein
VVDLAVGTFDRPAFRRWTLYPPAAFSPDTTSTMTSALVALGPAQ